MASNWDKFTAMDWPRFAGHAGKVTTVTCVVMGIVGIIIGRWLAIQITTIVIGVLISILELQVIYSCFEPCGRLHNQLLEDLKFKRGWVRAILYICLSAICYVGGTIAIMPGVFLDLTAILYIFASITEYQDDLDQKALKRTQGNYQPVDEQQSKFGTFA